MSLRRLILKDEATLDDVRRVAAEDGWEERQTIAADERQPLQVIWLVPDRAASVHYVEDTLVGLRYLMFRGYDTDDVRLHAGARLPSYTVAESTALLRDPDPAERRHGVLVTCLSAPIAAETPYLPALARAAADPEPAVRHAVILGLGFVDWPETEPILERLATDDADPSVRDAAGGMLAVKQQIRRSAAPDPPSDA